MTSNNPIQNTKKYIAGIHKFIINKNPTLITVQNCNIGIGTTLPKTKFDINGDMILSGNIGIGTNYPLQSLHVQNQSYFMDNIGVGTTLPRKRLDLQGGDVIVSGNIGIDTINPRQKLDIQNGDIIVSGNIGIGTTTPLNSLHIQYQSYFMDNIGVGTTTARKLLDIQGGDAIISGNIGIGTTNPIQKLDIQGGDAIVSGNIGIGTTTPLNSLHVEGQSYFVGNVGIGTTNPQYPLHVTGVISSTAFIGLGSGFTNMVLLTSGTSWTIPANVQKWKVTLVGGGGGGAGTNTAAGTIGNGGGSGCVVIGTYNYVSGKTEMTYTIGALGAGGATTANGTAGTATITNYDSVTYSAGGGDGGRYLGVNTGGAGGTSNIVYPNAYPPSALTDGVYSTTLTTAVYGNGTYNLSQSPSGWATYQVYKLFNYSYGALPDIWHTNDIYTLTGNYYAGTAYIVPEYLGEWIKIQLSVNIYLYSYRIWPRTDTTGRDPRDWKLYGSTDNTNWTVIDTQTNIGGWTYVNSVDNYKEFIVNSSTSYNYFAFVVNRAYSTSMQVGEFRLYGSETLTIINSPKYLTFNGNNGRTGGVQAATNTISGNGANTPLGFGIGGDTNGIATGGHGIAATGYGGGGGGGKNGSGTTARTGGNGAPGLLIIEY